MRALSCLVLTAMACRSVPTEAPTAPEPEPVVLPDRPTPVVLDQRVVALGDLHADLAQTLAALRLAGVVDEQAHWSGGTDILVQTGDQTDRGPDSLAILQLLVRLETEAEAAGGRVVALIGNHEVMNTHGDWRYVTPDDVAAYGGVEARARDFSADGMSGQFVRNHDAVALVGDTVFVHGGIHPDWAEKGIDAINAEVRIGIDHPEHEAVGADGPLWFRGYAQAPEPDVCEPLDDALRSLGARRMVMGHTVQASGEVTTRCDGKLALIDVGLASYYGSNLAVWELVNGDARMVTPAGTVDLPDPG